MKYSRRLKILTVLLACAAGFAAGRFTSGGRKVSGREFISIIDPVPRQNSAFSASLIGISHDRAYLEYWSALPLIGSKQVVIWTEFSDLPPDVVRELKAGKNPWADHPATGAAR